MYENELKALNADQWEQFAQDVLHHLGFNIVVGPSVGADEGLDMVVMSGEKRYLVSCKHNLTSGKNVGIADEVDVSDRVRRHKCEAFIAFYSTGPTTGLKKKFRDLAESGIHIVEIYKGDIFDIMPTMMGFTLHKYFPRPQDISHHMNEPSMYKPLICLNPKCGRDILIKENINWSMVSLVSDEKKFQLLYGCKQCVGDKGEVYWAEISQIRYIEELLSWRILIDNHLSSGLIPGKRFYQNWAKLQEGVIQILVPPGWGRWLG